MSPAAVPADSGLDWRLAPAKVNLALHVVGRRADGYHLLDSVVVFPPIGDRLALAPRRPDADIDGPVDLVVTAPPAVAVALGPAADNLVVRAGRALAARVGRPVAPVALILDKCLPVAAGLGGGSADAAMALRLLAEHWRVDLAARDLANLALSLGADVPMCLAGTPLRAGGIGEVLTPLPPLPQAGIVLVNPNVHVATPPVFRRLERRDNPPLPTVPSRWRDAADLCDWLRGTRNDLTAAAIAEAPVIAEVLGALAVTDPGHAGMSGSGATCFALYADRAAAAVAAMRLAAARPGWWTASAALA